VIHGNDFLTEKAGSNPGLFRFFFFFHGPAKLIHVPGSHDFVFKLMVDVVMKVNLTSTDFNRLRKAKRVGT